MTSTTNNKNGYIALVTSVVLMMVVLATASLVSNSNFLGLFDAREQNLKQISRVAAKGCLEYARLQLSSGDYEGGDTLSVGNYTCTVGDVVVDGDETTVTATSTAEDVYTELRLVMNSYDLEQKTINELE